jgi:hypothetical protein
VAEKYAPVIVFVYQRPNGAKQVLDALADNYLAKETDVFIYANAAYPKISKNIKQKHLQSIAEVGEIIRQYCNCFKSYTIIYRKKHLHVLDSMKSAIEEVFQQFDRVICLEDDLVVSRNFLDYCNSALEFYKDNDDVFSVCSYNALPCETTSGLQDSFLFELFRSWGYGLWKNKYIKIDFAKVIENIVRLPVQDIFDKYVNLYQNFAHLVLVRNINKISFLDAYFMYWQLETKKFSVYPTSNFVQCVANSDGISKFSYKECPIDDGRQRRFAFSCSYIGDFYQQNQISRFCELEFDFRQIVDKHFNKDYEHIIMTALNALALTPSLESYFIRRDIKRIAIYACGLYGKIFYNIIKSFSSIKVAYAIDRSDGVNIGDENIQVWKTVQSDIPIDAVIVSYLPQYLSIRDSLRKQTNVPVCDILSIILQHLIDEGTCQKLMSNKVALLDGVRILI